MVQARSLHQTSLFLSLFTLLCSGISNIALYPLVAQAQSSSSLTNSAAAQWLAKRPQNASNSAKSGGVRGECPVGTKSLRALMPDNDPGQTTQDYPTFWVYVPFGQTSFTPPGEDNQVTVSSAKFVLLDENRKPALKKPLLLHLPNQAGVVRLTIPSTEKPLEVGKDYQWFLSILCDANQPSSNPTVSGWLTRVQTAAKPQGQAKTTQSMPQSQASPFWFEFVSQVANARTQKPHDWSDLLRQFDLQEFAQQPIAELKVEK